MLNKPKLFFVLAGLMVLCLIFAGEVSASFYDSDYQPLFAAKAAIRKQEDQEAPTPATVPTLPVELWTQTATPGADGFIKHTVLEGQFLWNISQLYGVPLEEIYALNNLTEDSITFPGDIILIKKIEPPTPEPTAALAELADDVEFTEEALPSLEPTPELTPTNTPVAESNQGMFERVFTSNSRFLAYGIFALVLLGIVLLIVSSRRMY